MTSSSASSSSSSPIWHNLVAGAVAGASSRMATAPLDLIRIRRQLSPPTLYPSESLWQSWAKIVKNEGGLSALFRGNLAAIYLWIGYSAVQFSTYNRCKEYIYSIHPHANQTAVAFGAGASAGLLATLATYPFDVCRTTFAARGITQTTSQAPLHSIMEPHFSDRMANNRNNKVPTTLSEFAVHLYKQKGVRGFFAGAGPATIQIIPYMGLNFAIYDKLTSQDRSVVLSGYAGSISGATSKILVYPIDTVKRRLQAQAFYVSADSRDYRNTFDCISRMYTEGGIVSFYRGVVPSVLKSTIASSLSFAFFRLTKNALETMQTSE